MVPVNEPLLCGNEIKYLSECIKSGWISSEGPFVKKFEDKLSSYVNREFGIAVCNGTAALDIAFEALGLERGDEVIMPAFTIISCISHIIRVGARPVLVDSNPDNWNMDVNQIESKITSKTKIILIVHLYGLPVDIDPILKLANKYKLKIIEDAAEMHGQKYYGRPCGSFGDISTFSFYSNKLITTGEGGMLVTDNSELAEKCRSLRNLCFENSRRFVHERLGWNYRMTNLQAAVGLAQLERIDKFIEIKRQMGLSYLGRLSKLNFIKLPLKQTCYADNIFWVLGCVIKDNCRINANEAINALEHRGVVARPFFCPMHKQPVLMKMGFFSEESYPVAENLYQNGFYLPSGLALTNDQMNVVVRAMYDIFQ